ncbi:MAG: XrtA system polysaccharide chain length determinant [Halioglobus sp.]|nr:XrtA system polysaccharide chain length determinant [Halioglobus sp.]
MQEILAQVFSYVWGVWRYRWLALVVAWLVAIGGWIWVWQLPESYVANARVYVDTNTVLRPLLQGLAIQPDIESRIGLLSRTLLSRPNLEKLMRMTDLDLQVTTAREKDKLLNDLKKSISLHSNRKDPSLYFISVQDPDRDTAKRIAQALITVFIESSLSGKRADTSGAQDFLEEQIKEYEARLIQAETRSANFRQRHRDVLGGTGGYYRNLNSARARLRQAKLMLREEENRAVDLQRQIDGEDPMYLPSTTTDTPDTKRRGPVRVPPSKIGPQISEVEVQLAQLRIKYTDRHPEVLQLLSRLEDLEAQKAEEQRAARERVREINARRKAGEPVEQFGDLSGLENSPVYMNMKQMLSESKSKAAALEVRVKEYEERVGELEEQVNTIPEIEAQLKQLDRDYSVIRTQHSQLLKRRETARMGQDMEKKATDVSFRVIDPPYVPLKPSEPNKVLLNAIVLAAGVMAGIGVAFLVSLISPVFFDPRTLAAVSGLPVLGSVTINLQKEQQRRELYGLLAFSSLTVCLVIAYAGMTLATGNLSWL